jgi:tetratricopeptide (TPR) repeat protein
MIGRLALGAALVLAAGSTPPGAGGPGGAPAAPAPTLGDRLGWNAWERTRTGLDRLEAGAAPEAAAAFDTALRLRPADPLASYNAGTGRLAAGRADALAPLEAAARAADATLAPDAWYNLGNARLAAGDPRGAVEAYAETLRRASDRLEAKKNLELALRALEQQRQRPQPPPPGAEAEPEQGQGGDGEDGAPHDSPPRPDPEAKPGPDGAAPETQAASPDPDAGRDETPGTSQAGPDARQRTLRDFRDQPDLDAEQAAALLAAVENLERQQRRERALERARARRGGDKDW